MFACRLFVTFHIGLAPVTAHKIMTHKQSVFVKKKRIPCWHCVLNVTLEGKISEGIDEDVKGHRFHVL